MGNSCRRVALRSRDYRMWHAATLWLMAEIIELNEHEFANIEVGVFNNGECGPIYYPLTVSGILLLLEQAEIEIMEGWKGQSAPQPGTAEEKITIRHISMPRYEFAALRESDGC